MIGVVVWPGLWDEGGGAEMTPVFGKDMRDDEDDAEGDEGKEEDDETTDEEGGEGFRKGESKEPKKEKVRMGLRMPYDLPLVPWCASTSCVERDWMGRVWPGFGNS